MFNAFSRMPSKLNVPSKWEYDCRDDSIETALGTSLSSFSADGSKSLATSSQDDRPPLVRRRNCGQETVGISGKTHEWGDMTHAMNKEVVPRDCRLQQRGVEPPRDVKECGDMFQTMTKEVVDPLGYLEQRRVEAAKYVKDYVGKCRAQDSWKRSEIEVGESMADWLRSFQETELVALKEGLLKELQARKQVPFWEDELSSWPEFSAKPPGSHDKAHLQKSQRSAGCSNGTIAVDRGATELSEAFQEIESLKLHMRMVQAQLIQDDLRTSMLKAQHDVSQARFDEMEESLANRLHLFAYHCSHEQMQDLEECIVQELCRSGTFRYQEEAIQCSDDRSLVMPRLSLSRSEIAAATKLRDDAWCLKQESEEVVKSAIEDRRRFESQMATEREEVQRFLQEKRKQWESERHAWENEMREVAQSAMEEHRCVSQVEAEMATNEQAWKRWQADQLAWRAEATEMIQELKESVISERKRGDSLSRHLRDYQDELHAHGSRDQQARLSLQDVQHGLTKNAEDVAGARNVFEEFQLKYVDEFQALQAMQQEAQSAQRQLEKHINAAIASVQAVSSEVLRSSTEAREMNSLTEMRFEEEAALNSMRRQSVQQQLLSEYNQRKARERLAQVDTKYEDLDNEYRVERRGRDLATDAETYLRLRQSSLPIDTTFSRMQKQVRPRSAANLRGSLSQSCFPEPRKSRMRF